MKSKHLIFQQDLYTLSELKAIVEAHILPTIEKNKSNIWLLEGDLGAGKTSTVQVVLSELGIRDVDSPTYSIINEYKAEGDGLVYHMDFYRIKDVDEAIGTGVEEILYGNHLCFIEWPEVILDLLPENYYLIELNHGVSELERGISIYFISEE